MEGLVFWYRGAVSFRWEALVCNLWSCWLEAVCSWLQGTGIYKDRVLGKSVFNSRNGEHFCGIDCLRLCCFREFKMAIETNSKKQGRELEPTSPEPCTLILNSCGWPKCQLSRHLSYNLATGHRSRGQWGLGTFMFSWFSHLRGGKTCGEQHREYTLLTPLSFHWEGATALSTQGIRRSRTNSVYV